ncbi:proline dehydrogenase family protein [bacterium]|nr:proline dehydrogenase family protein [bacterium]
MTTESNQIETRVQEIGKAIFSYAQSQTPSVFNAEFYTGKLIGWAMEDEEFKINLFRFVDVLPTLRDSSAIIRHAQEYFKPVAHRIPGLLRWGLDINPDSLAAKLSAQLVKSQIKGMAERFILGETPEESLSALRKIRKAGMAFTVDLLGEATLSEEESEEYFNRYLTLLETLAEHVPSWPEAKSLIPGHFGEETAINVSVKLSALYSQSGPLNYEESLNYLSDRLGRIMRKASEIGAYVFVDMEDTKFTDLTIDVVKKTLSTGELSTYARAGFVLQAYLKRTEADVRGIIDWAKKRGTTIGVRLVKGAYWDTEKMLAEQNGWEPPVFEEKSATDANYEKLTGLLLSNTEVIFPAFASHNIRSLSVAAATAEVLGVPKTKFELQSLYGMAEPIKEAFLKQGYLIREYAPIGKLIPGMGYLVRRLLENTSNEGFLRLGFHEHEKAEVLLKKPDPKKTDYLQPKFAEFENVPAIDFSLSTERIKLQNAITALQTTIAKKPIQIHPILGGKDLKSDKVINSTAPDHIKQVVAHAHLANRNQAEEAIKRLQSFFPSWRKTPVEERAQILERTAEIISNKRAEFMAITILEAGKPWVEADKDIAEAIDFLRFYAKEARKLFTPERLGHYPAELNHYLQEPRGVTVVIGPWNFPVAIPCGMFAAALVTGNTALLKPSQHTPWCAEAIFRAFLEAGLPPEAAAFMPCSGAEVGSLMVTHQDVTTMVFTGSREVGLEIIEKASHVSRGQNHIKRVIAELGGKNAMIVDEDADLDEAIKGVIYSAFGYVGQKCSACSRVYVVGSAYDEFIDRISQALTSLVVGPASDPGTFIGPVISSEAQARINAIIESAKKDCKLVAQLKLPQTLTSTGSYVAPAIFTDIPAGHQLLTEEIFGPVLAVAKAKSFTVAIDLANNSDYALTGAVFSRSPQNLQYAREEFRVGNLYINRHSTGALVYRQPFGGFKMSGVGSKAGGPDYLAQFTVPRAISENTMRRGFAPVE